MYKHALALFAAELSNANPAQFKDNREVGQQFWTDLIKDDMRLTNDACTSTLTHGHKTGPDQEQSPRLTKPSATCLICSSNLPSDCFNSTWRNEIDGVS